MSYGAYNAAPQLLRWNQYADVTNLTDADVKRLAAQTGNTEAFIRNIASQSQNNAANVITSAGGLVFDHGKVMTQDDYRADRDTKTAQAAQDLVNKGVDPASAQRYATAYKAEVEKGRDPNIVAKQVQVTVDAIKRQQELKASAPVGATPAPIGTATRTTTTAPAPARTAVVTEAPVGGLSTAKLAGIGLLGLAAVMMMRKSA